MESKEPSRQAFRKALDENALALGALAAYDTDGAARKLRSVPLRDHAIGLSPAISRRFPPEPVDEAFAFRFDDPERSREIVIVMELGRFKLFQERGGA